MSVLAWLFGLSAAAVAFPVLFHLIRRTPRGQTEFSTLMFLKPSPPRLTKRSRIDHWLLLLLRILAIALLAIAFMRPFFRSGSSLAEFDVDHRRIAILLDTSASMRRGEAWQQAMEQVQKTVENIETGDQLALYTFDRQLKRVVGFSDAASSASSLGGQSTQASQILSELETLSPGWAASDLGGAMVALANELDDWHDESRNDQTGRRPKLQMVIVSDMQASADIRALDSYQWPTLVKVDFQSILPTPVDNATLQLLPGVTEDLPPKLRLRVSNAVGSSSDQLAISWDRQSIDQARSVKNLAASEPDNAALANDDQEISMVLGPGARRVLSISLEDAIGTSSFILRGDAEPFDNQFFVASPEQQTLRMLVIGDENEDDPEGQFFYLKRAFTDTPTRKFAVRQIPADRLEQAEWQMFPEELDTVQPEASMVVVNSLLNPAQVQAIEDYLQNGGLVVFVLTEADTIASAGSLAKVKPANVKLDEAFQMLGEINYRDPVFQPFAQPAFSDFTSIRFWEIQPVEVSDDCQVLARFDNRQPAVWARDFDNDGRLVCFSFGWKPSQSQFALSPKFIVLFSNLLELGASIPVLATDLEVGEVIEFPESSQPRVMRKPNGVEDRVGPGQSRYRRTSTPGLYRLLATEGESAGRSQLRFAVNLDRRESEGDVLAVEQLERLGVQTGSHETAASELAQMRELRDREIESRQKIWKWAIVGALAILMLETFLAGRRSSALVGGMVG